MSEQLQLDLPEIVEATVQEQEEKKPKKRSSRTQKKTVSEEVIAETQETPLKRRGKRGPNKKTSAPQQTKPSQTETATDEVASQEIKPKRRTKKTTVKDSQQDVSQKKNPRGRRARKETIETQDQPVNQDQKQQEIIEPAKAQAISIEELESVQTDTIVKRRSIVDFSEELKDESLETTQEKEPAKPYQKKRRKTKNTSKQEAIVLDADQLESFDYEPQFEYESELAEDIQAEERVQSEESKSEESQSQEEPISVEIAKPGVRRRRRNRQTQSQETEQQTSNKNSKDTTDEKTSSADNKEDSVAKHTFVGRQAKRLQRERQANAFAAQKQKNASPANQQSNNRKNKDHRQHEVVEPKTSREELEALKLSDLRSQAVDLGIATAGVKKNVLVDSVYEALVKQEGFFNFQGILDIDKDGTGYVRAKGYLPSENDIFIHPSVIKQNCLRKGDEIYGIAYGNGSPERNPQLQKVITINGRDPESITNRPRFGDLTPVFPSESLRMEHGKDSILGRCIDLVAPIGKGQRGLIVSPPKAGKTTVLKKIAESIAANNPEVHLICLLVDERPEEVTDMQRSIKGEVVASTFDMPSENHITVAELVIERAKRIVELGGDVVILLDSITRLARAYNLAQPASGRILSGGVDSTALYPPKRFLGAARNIENGGSLTILASALVDTGSKMDEVIFEEFKGTGNMELKLDRDLADRRIFPAIDPVSSGTRKEELLLDPGMAPFIWGLRRLLAGMNNNERAMTQLIKGLRNTNNNEEFLIRSAKKAQLNDSINGEL
ncbi:MAG: transcription termination factor Rho [Coriobacteriales bacterium]|nr:transcription termination factor Rho [Coriobacteriales bacterium]